MTEKRLDWIDNLRGFGMILVVWGHMNLPYVLETIVYSFHMPLFFFISGYLYRKKEESFLSTLKRKSSGMLIPYFFFATISIPFGIGLALIQNVPWSFSDVFMHYFYLDGVGWNSPLWFLVVLFFIEIIYIVIDKLKWNNIFFIFVCFLLGYGFSITRMEFPFGLNIVLYGIVFYYLGHIGRATNIGDKWRLSKVKTVSVLVALVLINIIFGLFLNSRVSVYHNQLGNYFWFYIAAISGSLVLFLLFKSTKRIKFLSFLGVNSVVIMCTHYFFKYTFILADRFFGGVLSVDRSLMFSLFETCIVLVCSIPICLFFNKYFPFFIGKRKI
ncbi:acyltransferase family protein [Listeria booriae]|uniref:Acyltransferase family protein n=1 Tax=Listeria booriae TaxID=1552123 RepID=A0A842ERF2_9LIST|nr:acyltransferase family protein [Listeria booriae]MBC1573185.1 acyltransferase family protein [Listeria booriae]MBC2207147.1 acyltransferase family protein [Listeria booriae]MBC2243573.1 acyltransferase family protein [Listeria booriae]